MIKALLTTVAALAIATMLASPAAAHTAMVQASPDRDATVGGSVTVIDLGFLDPVSEASVIVTYNGTPVAGRTSVTTGQVVTFTLDQPLSQPGRYQVSYEMVSADSDFTTGGYFFTFDPVAGQPERLEPPEPEGFPTTVALSGAGLAAVVGLVGLFVLRSDSRRSAGTRA